MLSPITFFGGDTGKSKPGLRAEIRQGFGMGGVLVSGIAPNMLLLLLFGSFIEKRNPSHQTSYYKDEQPKMKNKAWADRPKFRTNLSANRPSTIKKFTVITM